MSYFWVNLDKKFAFRDAPLLSTKLKIAMRNSFAKGFILWVLSLLFCGQMSLEAKKSWYNEMLYKDWRQSFSSTEVLYHEKTEEQDLMIFRNEIFGKVLLLDGIVQLTDKDEFVYHELIAHVPLFSHENPQKVLIIGGGDGGALREVLRHTSVKKVVLVEIDPEVIAFSKKHFPELSGGAFEDPRVDVVIQDGSQFVKDTLEKFDVILCDSCDPVGPAAVLFTEEFYGDCKNILTEEGIFVNQAGVPFMQQEEFVSIYQNLKTQFEDVGFYLGVIPTYVGGFMSFGWASKTDKYRDLSLSTLQERLQNVSGDMEYYSPEIHKASFVLPRFIAKLLKNE